jgi:hypothetical protein
LRYEVQRGDAKEITVRAQITQSEVDPQFVMLVPVYASSLSDARFGKAARAGAAFCARSINPFEGSRWWLRQMRADGRPQLNGYGNSIFFVCSLLILRGL